MPCIRPCFFFVFLFLSFFPSFFLSFFPCFFLSFFFYLSFLLSFSLSDQESYLISFPPFSDAHLLVKPDSALRKMLCRVVASDVSAQLQVISYSRFRTKTMALSMVSAPVTPSRIPLWLRRAINRDASTGPLARPFARTAQSFACSARCTRALCYAHSFLLTVHLIPGSGEGK